jgi:hypothetical protein
MENEVPMSQLPMPQPEQEVPSAVPPAYPDVEAMKVKARELAIQQFLASKAAAMPAPQPIPQQQSPMEQPRIIYLRRNLTVAELIVVFAISCGIVYGIPNIVKFAVDKLPQIEVKVK